MRELNTLLSSGSNINRVLSFFLLFFFVAPKTRRCGIVFRVSANSFEIASRADAAFARAGARGFISRTFHCNFKKEGEGALGIVPSDMALLNFSLSGKQSRINAMD